MHHGASQQYVPVLLTPKGLMDEEEKKKKNLNATEQQNN